MIVAYRTGDLLGSGADALVNPVNCVGVLGAGLALQFARRFPAHCEPYRALCRVGQLRPGQVLPVSVAGTGPIVYHAATKDHRRDPSRLEWVSRAAHHLAACLDRRIHESPTPTRTVAIPPLGCGLGGLRWDAVRPLLLAALDHHLADHDVTVWLYAPPPGAPAQGASPPEASGAPLGGTHGASGWGNGGGPLLSRSRASFCMAPRGLDASSQGDADMSETTESTVPSADATEEKGPKMPTAKRTAAKPDFDAMVAEAVAKALAGALPTVVDAVVAKLTPVAPPVTPATEAPAPEATAPAAVTTTKTTTTTTTTSTSSNQRWTGTGYVAKLEDRATPNGTPELVVRFFPAGKDTCYYPVAYKTVREQILAVGLQVGDKVSLGGFVSVNTPSAGKNAGKTFKKLVITEFAVMSRKADRPLAAAAGAGAVLDLADAQGADRPLALDAAPAAEAPAAEAPVASETPASDAVASLLTQLPPLESAF